jgi:hypothetical protein
MAALWESAVSSDRLFVAACRRIGPPIADIQHENPRGVGKGRLLTRSCRSRCSEAVVEGDNSRHYFAVAAGGEAVNAPTEY